MQAGFFHFSADFGACLTPLRTNAALLAGMVVIDVMQALAQRLSSKSASTPKSVRWLYLLHLAREKIPDGNEKRSHYRADHKTAQSEK